MALSRPVAGKTWDASTSTGTGTQINFGIPVTQVAAHISNASTEAIAGTIQGSAGASTGWVTLHTFTTGQSTGASNVVASGSYVVDKARVNISTNPTTGVLEIWLLGA